MAHTNQSPALCFEIRFSKQCVSTNFPRFPPPPFDECDISAAVMAPATTAIDARLFGLYVDVAGSSPCSCRCRCRCSCLQTPVPPNLNVPFSSFSLYPQNLTFLSSRGPLIPALPPLHALFPSDMITQQTDVVSPARPRRGTGKKIL